MGDNDKTQTQPGVNSRNFERDGDRGRRGTGATGTGATGTGATGSSSSGPRDSRPCHAFQRGECRYGSDCRYVHQEPKQVREQVREKEQSKEEDKEVALTHVPVPVVKKLKCPPGLFRSRDFLFKGISLAQRKNIVMDTVASFSVTESNMADKMSEAILQAAERVKPHDNVMFDGMACVGKYVWCDVMWCV